MMATSYYKIDIENNYESEFELNLQLCEEYLDKDNVPSFDNLNKPSNLDGVLNSKSIIFCGYYILHLIDNQIDKITFLFPLLSSFLIDGFISIWDCVTVLD